MGSNPTPSAIFSCDLEILRFSLKSLHRLEFPSAYAWRACGSVDRATDYESVGRRFESSRARHFSMDVMNDIYLMKEALREAKKAFEKGEPPVGAVIVRDGEIIARGHNLRESLQDPTAHAEMLAIRAAAAELGRWRLNDCEIYVTLEPCVMCAGAMVLARLSRLVYGADDPKAGAVRSLINLVSDERFNHQIEVTSGILAAECGNLLRDFFSSRRKDRSMGL